MEHAAQDGVHSIWKCLLASSRDQIVSGTCKKMATWTPMSRHHNIEMAVHYLFVQPSVSQSREGKSKVAAESLALDLHKSDSYVLLEYGQISCEYLHTHTHRV